MIENAEIGTIGLIQQDKNGSITQLGLTQEQSDLLQAFVGSLSQEKQLVRLPSDYNLFSKDDCWSKADIRRKINPMVNLIEVVEMEEDKETIDIFIKTAKKYVNILCDREVFEEK